MAKQERGALMARRASATILMESPPCAGFSRPLNPVVHLSVAADQARRELREVHKCDVIDLSILSDEEAIALLDLARQDQRA